MLQKTIRKHASIKNKHIFENENILTATLKFCGHLTVQPMNSRVTKEQFTREQEAYINGGIKRDM